MYSLPVLAVLFLAGVSGKRSSYYGSPGLADNLTAVWNAIHDLEHRVHHLRDHPQQGQGHGYGQQLYGGHGHGHTQLYGGHGDPDHPHHGGSSHGQLGGHGDPDHPHHGGHGHGPF